MRAPDKPTLQSDAQITGVGAPQYAGQHTSQRKTICMRRGFVYVTDERGFELARYSAISLAMSQREPCEIHIFCYRFSPRIPPPFSAAMADLRASLIFHDINDAAVEHHQTHGHVTTPTLLKPSAVGKLIGEYDRIVYLDNDILVFDDLMIDDINFGQAPIAAVVDMEVADSGRVRSPHLAG